MAIQGLGRPPRKPRVSAATQGGTLRAGVGRVSPSRAERVAHGIEVDPPVGVLFDAGPLLPVGVWLWKAYACNYYGAMHM